MSSYDYEDDDLAQANEGWSDLNSFPVPNNTRGRRLAFTDASVEDNSMEAKRAHAHKSRELVFDDHGQPCGYYGWTREGFVLQTQASDLARPHERRNGIPEWAKDYEALRRHILLPAMRDVRIADLYWRVGYNVPQIADEMGLSVNSIKAIIKRLWRGCRKRAKRKKKKSN